MSGSVLPSLRSIPYLQDEKTDAQSVGKLVAETYRKFNLDFASPEEQEKLLGPFRNAWSAEPAHRDAITRVLMAEMVFCRRR